MKTLISIGTIILILTACSKDDQEPVCQVEVKSNARFFEFQASEGTLFIAWTNKPAVIDRIHGELQKEVSSRNLHINGKILKIDKACKINHDWSWYFDPEDWDLAEISIELCDGNPQYVEENLDEYIHIQRYCPWSSVVLREIDRPF